MWQSKFLTATWWPFTFEYASIARRNNNNNMTDNKTNAFLLYFCFVLLSDIIQPLPLSSFCVKNAQLQINEKKGWKFSIFKEWNKKRDEGGDGRRGACMKLQLFNIVLCSAPCHIYTFSPSSKIRRDRSEEVGDRDVWFVVNRCVDRYTHTHTI